MARSRRILFLTLGCTAMAAVTIISVHSDWRRHSISAESAFFDGDYNFAEKQFLAAANRAEAFGEEDPRLASALTDLASFYYFVGRYREAEQLFKRAIRIEQASYGEQHPQIAANMFNLVNVYAADRRLREARTVAERALAIQTQAIGTKHHSLIESLDIYANVLTKAGRHAEAQAARQRVEDLLIKPASGPLSAPIR